MRVFLLIILVSLTASCTTQRYSYTASPANNPIFTKKGESKIAGYYSTSSGNETNNIYADGLDLQGAYAVGNNWAITASYLNRKEKDIFGESYNIFNSSVVKYKRQLLELGGGYFTPLNKKETIVFNIFGGFGAGKFSLTDNGINTDNNAYSRMHQSYLSRWFIQPSINFLPGSYVRISYAMKFTFLKYNNIITNYTPEEQSSLFLQNLGSRGYNFIEPSLAFQFGIPQVPWVKLETIMSGVNNKRLLNYELDVRSLSVSVGLNFDPSKMNSKKG